MKKGGNAFDDAGGVDATRGVDIIFQTDKYMNIRIVRKLCNPHEKDSHLAFEVFHDIQKMVIHIWLIVKLDFDSIKIAEGIRDIQWPRVRTCSILWRPITITGHNGRACLRSRRYERRGIQEVFEHWQGAFDTCYLVSVKIKSVPQVGGCGCGVTVDLGGFRKTTSFGFRGSQ